MAELQNLAYVVFAASDLDAWRGYAADIIGLGTADAGDGGLGLRMDGHPWRILIEPGDDDDLTHAGWDLGSDEALDEYVAALRAKGAEVREAGQTMPLRAAQGACSAWSIRSASRMNFTQAEPVCTMTAARFHPSCAGPASLPAIWASATSSPFQGITKKACAGTPKCSACVTATA